MASDRSSPVPPLATTLQWKVGRQTSPLCNKIMINVNWRLTEEGKPTISTLYLNQDVERVVNDTPYEKQLWGCGSCLISMQKSETRNMRCGWTLFVNRNWKTASINRMMQLLTLTLTRELRLSIRIRSCDYQSSAALVPVLVCADIHLWYLQHIYGKIMMTLETSDRTLLYELCHSRSNAEQP